MNWWKWPYCWTTKRIHWTSRRYICHLVACPYPPSNVECRPYGSLFGQLTGTELKRWLILLWTSAGGVAATILLSASNALATFQVESRSYLRSRQTSITLAHQDVLTGAPTHFWMHLSSFDDTRIQRPREQDLKGIREEEPVEYIIYLVEIQNIRIS